MKRQKTVRMAHVVQRLRERATMLRYMNIAYLQGRMCEDADLPRQSFCETQCMSSEVFAAGSVKIVMFCDKTLHD